MQTNNTVDGETYRNQGKAFSRPALFIYDYGVLWFSNKFLWKCPTHLILNFYNQHVSANHLDIGVGTGYFLDKCHFPSLSPHIVLADLYPAPLQLAAARLRRYNPATRCINILEPISNPEKFDSVGINYVFHCLPGRNLFDKEPVFQNLRSLLNSGGVIFGSTLLGKGVSPNFLAKRFLRFYNAKKVFFNAQDSYTDLQEILARNFKRHSLELKGCAAFFAAWI